MARRLDGMKTNITREQIELTKLITELENSVAVAKEQINTLTVETLHLRYLAIKKNKKDPEYSQPKKAKMDELNLAIVKTDTTGQGQEEEMDSD